MYDAVFVYSIGLQTLAMSHSVQPLARNVSCRVAAETVERPWTEGPSLINYMNAVSA